ncbi:MAG: 1-deoxy-D-xylulose-5-phosphate reductoisomerase [Thermomicrobiales bacterium]|nr:1-deoxy-D-xylulose-5-phosphate reductoisomerase [Thermomicrobiales bacterium]
MQTLNVLSGLPERFQVAVLAARTLSPALLAQAERFRPDLVAVSAPPPPGVILPPGVHLAAGPDAFTVAATHPAVSIVVAATSGHAGIIPIVRAIEADKIVALANKETIVCAGELVMSLADERGVSIRPVDSEHSALWQALDGASPEAVERLILTASGGPFRKFPAEALANVTADQALAHPTWSMGGKITIDSATLMNKGLEVLEARWLFGVPLARIDVLIHPESIVHSLVAFIDGNQIAQLGLPDMRLPIQYALTYPERLAGPWPRLSLATQGMLTFEQPDCDRFPALALARQAGEMGVTYPTALSAADEIAVEAFIAGRIRFTAIPEVVRAVLEAHRPDGPLSFEAIFATDAWARREAARIVACS